MGVTIDVPGSKLSAANPVGPAKQDRWTPVRNGPIYCSPACGCKCKFSDYEKAHRDSAVLCEKLGTNWKPRVWENAGWHWSAILKGPDDTSVEVCAPGREGLYSIDAHLPQQTYMNTSDPVSGVRQLMQEARRQGQRIIDRAEFFEANTGPAIEAKEASDGV